MAVTINAAYVESFADITLKQLGRPGHMAIVAALGREDVSALLS